jgi:hypothetical protein
MAKKATGAAKEYCQAGRACRHARNDLPRILDTQSFASTSIQRGLPIIEHPSSSAAAMQSKTDNSAKMSLLL